MQLPILDSDFYDVVVEAGNDLTNACHEQAKAMGWHEEYAELQALIEDGKITGKLAERVLLYFVATKLMLSVSELGEAMEGVRKGRMDDHLPQYTMLGCELADTVIRCMDLAGLLDEPLGEIIAAKLRYNATRADHQPAARDAEGGKAV